MPDEIQVQDTHASSPAMSLAAACACPICRGSAEAAGEGVPGVVQGNGKISLSIDEAAARLTRTGVSWNGGDLSQPTVLTYSFMSSADRLPEDVTEFVRFNPQQIAAAELALLAWSDVANVQFVRVGFGLSGEEAFSNNATVRFAGYGAGQEKASAFAFLPGRPANRADSSFQGDAWFNAGISYNANPVMWDYGQQVLVHEIGHVLGLKHPGDYNAGDGDANEPITYVKDAQYYEDARQYSVMSYFASSNTGATLPGFASAPQLHDIAAAQKLYGPNMNAFTGDTVYGFNSNTGRPWFTALSVQQPLVFAVWDAGGNDTFDFSGYAKDQVIELNAGRFSNVGGFVNNVTIAQGAVIENALGGSGADQMFGNAAANLLAGGAGNDTLRGADGDDVLGGQDGDDRVEGGSGRDALFGDAGADLLIGGSDNDLLMGQDGDDVAGGQDGDDRLEGGAGRDALYGDAGNDLLVGGAGDDLLMGQDGDDVMGGQDGNDRIFGGAGSDQLYGDAGDDTLEGGAGADILFGQDGADRFVFLAAGDSAPGAADRIFDFSPGQDLIDLSGIDANTSTAADDAFVFAAAFSNVAGQAVLSFDAALNMTTLRADVNGDGLADFELLINGAVGPTSGWIL